MENYKHIDTFLSEMDSNIAYKRKNSIASGMIILLVGIAAFLPSVLMAWPHGSALPLLLQVTGIIAFVLGVVKLFLRKEYFVSASTHQRLITHEIFFDVKEEERLAHYCTSGQLNEIKKLKRVDTAGGLKLVIMRTPDHQLCFLQVIRFVIFEYVPQSQVLQYSKEEADQLVGLL